MTSVVGILNKRGAAIAADSAVTRKKIIGDRQRAKVTKNGNKMIRLSDVDPITVMITGNAGFLDVPWDLIIRRFRQQKGMEHQPTVEAAARALFDYIASNAVFWNESACMVFLGGLVKMLFNEAVKDMPGENDRNTDGSLKSQTAFKKAFIQNVSSIAKDYARDGSCPQFEGYTLDEFRKTAAPVIDGFFEENNREYKRSHKKGDDNKGYPMDILDAIRPSFEHALLMVIGSRLEIAHSSARLIFTGFGSDQQYPSLVSALVCEGFASRVNYSIRPQDVVCISDKRPVAICPFAQKDVIESILQGIHSSWLKTEESEAEGGLGLGSLTCESIKSVLEPLEWEENPGLNFMAMLDDVDFMDLYLKYYRDKGRMLNANQREWEKALENYDLEAMAALADSLINLTGFQRILTFSQEGVGGLVDLAVISRNEGFTWLRRKSWYHKDVGGKDGSFGI